MLCRVKVTDRGKTVEIAAEAGKTLYSVLAGQGFFADFSCGGGGRCGRCLVLARGALSEMGKEEKKLLAGREGRLACFTRVLGDCEISLPKSGMSIASGFEGAGGEFELSPWASGLGAAVDIGTTTVVAYLCDLKSGRVLGVAGEVNAQRAFGADVMARIAACADASNMEKMTAGIREQVARMIKKLCLEAGRESSEVNAMCVCGNTVMEHLFCGLDPSGMGALPFSPVSLFGEGFVCETGDMGLAKNCEVFVLPAASAFVGGDVTAAVLALSSRLGKNALIADIGTNGELVLAHGGRLLCAAAAAGPAFEGCGVSLGMPATVGAVSAVYCENGKLRVETLGGGKAVGICGSGLVDALAAALDCGALDSSGRLRGESELVTRKEGRLRFEFGGVYIDEGDVRTLQLAKAAVAAGMETLLEAAGISAGEIEALFIAGGFGLGIRPGSAARIGLLPKELAGRAMAAGNAAGKGACLALLSEKAREKASQVRDKMEYIDLSSSAVFMEKYVEKMAF